MAVMFGDSERHILSLFVRGNHFFYGGHQYTVIESDKPTCSYGEPKTDIYVAAESNGVPYEFKISYKQENANFLENKTNSERARLLLGEDWDRIILQATHNLESEFNERELIFKTDYRRTEAGSITLGWKFEIMNVLSGQLSGDMLLTREQVEDVYSGTNLPRDKQDARVNGRIIRGSGIANLILLDNSNPRNAQEAIDASMTIREYVNRHPRVYFACKALNYRSLVSKYDGNRPLAVYVDWRVINGKLAHKLVFNEPLIRGGDEIAGRLIAALRSLRVSNTNELNRQNVADPRIIHY